MATSSNAQAVDEPDQEPCCLTAVHLGGGVKDLIEVMSARVGGDVHDVGSSAGELARGCIAMARAQVATAMALKQSTKRLRADELAILECCRLGRHSLPR